METLVLFAGFLAWSAFMIWVGFRFAASKMLPVFISLFDKEGLKKAYKGDEKSAVKKALEI
jgi:hypothetical protein